MGNRTDRGKFLSPVNIFNPHSYQKLLWEEGVKSLLLLLLLLLVSFGVFFFFCLFLCGMMFL